MLRRVRKRPGICEISPRETERSMMERICKKVEPEWKSEGVICFSRQKRWSTSTYLRIQQWRWKQLADMAAWPTARPNTRSLDVKTYRLMCPFYMVSWQPSLLQLLIFPAPILHVTAAAATGCSLARTARCLRCDLLLQRLSRAKMELERWAAVASLAVMRPCRMDTSVCRS